MIKNERQYKITRAQAHRFSGALRNVEVLDDETEGLHPLLLKARKDALRSQLADLEDDLREYEALKAGAFQFDQLKSVSELPKQLIMARIARGMSQRDLAERLGLKEQQIQRYEASDYSSASLARISKVIDALGVDVGGLLPADETQVPLKDILNKVAMAGLPPEFIHRRLIPQRRLPLNLTAKEKDETTLTQEVAEVIGRVFQWPYRTLLDDKPLDLQSAVGGVRFKAIANANPERVTAYTVYAHYLSLLVSQASEHHPIRSIPTDPYMLRDDIESQYGEMSLSSIVNYAWDFGVPVLPLDDPGVFHGACFRENGRNVIVLKQKTSSESRWEFDLLHEIWHAIQEPELLERTVLEPNEGAADSSMSDEEAVASKFAAVVLLNGRGPELAEKCLAAAGNNMRRLKAAVKRTASQEGIRIDSLANYIAFRLAAEKGRNWWGTANSFQELGDPWTVVRDVFFERVNLAKLAEPDRELIAQALTPWKEMSNA